MNNFNITGQCPDVLKVARVNPIYKKESREKPSNYRPITILSLFNTIFAIIQRLLSFWNKHKIFTQTQFGFWETFSATVAITQFCE